MPYALVTGASKGIGKAIALELARRNYDILLVARSEDLLKVLASEIEQAYKVKVFHYAIDLCSMNAPQLIYDWCSVYAFDVTILVNNAGFGLSGPFDSNPISENTNMILLNVVVPTQLCQLFIPLLRNGEKSYILNIVSSAAYQAIPLLGIYSATKSYLLSFSRAIHHELIKSGISVTAVSPGPTDTDWIHRAQIKGKALKMANKVNMQPATVATIAIRSMLSGKIEVITGGMNKAGAFMAWLLPKKLVERLTSQMYE